MPRDWKEEALPFGSERVCTHALGNGTAEVRMTCSIVRTRRPSELRDFARALERVADALEGKE